MENFINIRPGYDISIIICDYHIKYQVFGNGFGIFSNLYDSKEEAIKAIDDFIEKEKTL